VLTDPEGAPALEWVPPTAALAAITGLALGAPRTIPAASAARTPTFR
jgi:hypothetical protein